MHSLSAAKALLTSIHSPDQLNTLLTELGFTTPPLPLDALARERLALPLTITTASVSRGPGQLRALILTLDANAPAKDTLIRVATRLSSRVPHLLWLLIATQHNTPLIAFAAWRPTSPLPQVAALVTYQNRIVDSDAETLCALAAINTRSAGPAEDLLRHARWLDILGREAVTRRFYRTLEHAITTLAHSLTPTPPPTDAAVLALLYASRLLFLSFLETKGWLNNDFGFLINGFADCMALGGSYQRRILEPLFFGTLNTRPTQRAKRAHAFGKIPFLNGGLFTRTPTERRLRHTSFTDDALGALYEQVLGKYRFTAREDSTTWSEAAVDPEMLGKAFESLMASDERRRSGAFFTPQSLVERITTDTLIEALHNPSDPPHTIEHALAGKPISHQARGRLLERISTLRILDPACGSGAFLVHTLETLATLRAHLGDITPIAAIRRTILTRSIFGVDIHPTAVWLCELRLWLSVVIESDERNPMHVLPLPNLDHQIRIGDSLAGGTFTHPIDPHTARTITTLRERYTRANGPRKRTLAKQLDRAERNRAIHNLSHTITLAKHERKSLLTTARTRDLFAHRTGTTNHSSHRLHELRTTIKRLHTHRHALKNGAALPFAFSTHYADAATQLGFDVIIGNPPWVRIHHINHTTRTQLRHTFFAFRHAAWHSGATNTHATRGFASQTDLAALFIERAISLLTPNGTLGLLVPAKLWHSLAGGGIRTLLLDKTTVTSLEDLTNAPHTFDAAVYPSIIIARHTPPTPSSLCKTTIHHHNKSTHWSTPLSTLQFDRSPGAPWLTIPPTVRTSFESLSHHSTPLAHSTLGRPTLGVKCGCNAAFIANTSQEEHDAHETRPHLTTITTPTHTALIERTILRPLIRGEHIRPWSITPSTEHIIWTHDTNGTPLPTLPPHTHTWLARWRPRLQRRSDARHQHRWWSLFRTEAANSTSARVIWSDFGQSPRATMLLPNNPAVPLNSCYILRPPTVMDALALTTLINTPLIAAWLNIIAEPARGGYHRFLGWTMALLPIPHNWPRARTILAPLSEHALTGTPPTREELHSATLDAYNITHESVAPLLTWNDG